MLANNACRVSLDSVQRYAEDRTVIQNTVDPCHGTSSENIKRFDSHSKNLPKDFFDKTSTKQSNLESPKSSHDLLYLGVQSQKGRSKSPLTVQEWVASLPDIHEIEEEATKEEMKIKTVNEMDNLTLGAEAGCIQQSNMAKILLHNCSKNRRSGSHPGIASVSTRGVSRMLTHWDTELSLKSGETASTLSNTSVESLLNSRAADPEDVLISLGFGGCYSFAKIPDRFLQHQSQAKGMSIDTFVETQSDILARFEAGFAGFKGLSGPAHRKPSPIVEKILQTLSKDEKLFYKNNSIHFQPNGIHLNLCNLNSSRPSLKSVALKVCRTKKCLNPILPPFAPTSEDICKWSDHFKEEKLNPLQRQDSFTSVSNTSVDSDWSDEEKEKLEKLFGAMSARRALLQYDDQLWNSSLSSHSSEISTCM